MDPPLPPPRTTIVSPNPPPTAISNAITQPTYADSSCSSPCSNQTDNWDDPLPQVPGSKLRVMCSFGGHIIPRIHDKALSYVGGETRIVVVDRNSSLSDVHDRLSRTLLSGHKFTLKYQLPNEELDSLISVTSNEDLENMIEENDRIMSTEPAKPARIRLFLFLAKPETTASMGDLLNDAKSEAWFVDALNNSDLLNRGASDSAIDNLLEFDGMVKIDSSTNLEIADQEVHTTTQDSPMVETSSSFDSGLSSPALENMHPIKVRVNEDKQGLDEQFSQMNVSTDAMNHIAVPKDNGGISDYHRSEKSLPVALRKPPLQPVQRKFTDPYSLPSPDSKQAGVYSLQSPDSITSDNSVTSAASITKHSDYQDSSTIDNQDNRAFIHETDYRNNINNPSSQIYFQQVQEHADVPSLQQNPQHQQLQFVQAPVQYIQHSGTGLMQVPSYYPIYAATPTNLQPFHQQEIDQQCSTYLMPLNHAQQYNLPKQSCVADAIVASSVTPPNQAMISEKGGEVLRTVQGPPPTYVQVPQNQFQQQYYDVSQIQPQTRTISSETDAEVRRTVQAPPPTYIQVPPNQLQQQFYDVSQIQHKTQTIPTERDADVRGVVQATYVQVPPNQFQQQYYDISQIQPQTQNIPTETDAEIRRTLQAPAPTPTYVQVQPNQFQQQYYGISHVHPHTQTIATSQAATTNYSYNYTYLPQDHPNYVQHQTPVPSHYQTITPPTALLISQATSQLEADNASQQIQNSQNPNN